MNFEHILSEIEKVDPEVYDRLDTRRHAMQRFRNISGRIALAAIPGAIGAMFSKAYGQSAATPKSILQYANTLEYLERDFYNLGVTNAATIGITGSSLTAITKIRDDERAHVNFLSAAIQGISGSVAADSNPLFRIDLTGNGGSTATTGPFAGAYQANGYLLFLGLAQTFEDTGVRAYKGRAGELVKNAYLQAALQIHSVEARHAAHIRYMRSAQGLNQGGATIPSSVIVKPWITQAQSGITVPSNTALDSVIAGFYAGATPESLSTQAGVNITTIAGVNGNISSNAATEAFDEPLTSQEVITALSGSFFY